MPGEYPIRHLNGAYPPAYLPVAYPTGHDDIPQGVFGIPIIRGVCKEHTHLLGSPNPAYPRELPTGTAGQNGYRTSGYTLACAPYNAAGAP